MTKRPCRALALVWPRSFTGLAFARAILPSASGGDPAHPGLRALAGALLASLALASGMSAQETPSVANAQAAAAPQPEVIAPENVVARAAETERSLREIEALLEASPEVEAIAKRLDDVGELWRQEAEASLRRLSEATTNSILVETERVWSLREKLVEGWDESLSKHVGSLTTDLEGIERQGQLWERTRDAKRVEALPPVLRATVVRVFESIEATRRSLRERRDSILTLHSAVLEEQRRVVGVLQAVDAARARARSQLFVRDSPVLWKALAAARPEEARQRMYSTWKSLAGALRIYVGEQAGGLAAFAFCLLFLVVVIARLGGRAARWASEDAAAAATARVLDRPLSAALLVLIVAYPLVIPKAPLLARWILGIVVLIPALRLIGPLLEGVAQRAFYVLSGWYAVAMLRELMAPFPLIVRILLLLEASAALVLLAWLLRADRLAALESVGMMAGALAVIARIAVGLLTVSLLSVLLGNLSLADVLVDGTLYGAYVALLLQGSALVLEGLWWVMLQTRPLALLTGVQRHTPLLRRRGSTFIRCGLAFVWLWLALGFFQVREPVWSGVVAVLTAAWPLGEIELSLSDLVAFGFTVWLALWLSRFVRFVLDEDVLPRAELPRGVPYAVSSFTHYVILLFGFMLAVSAAGFDMSRFALIVGALGVGIGIGLQDVVNNFVSGVILLFERPVQTGDTVQVGDIFGDVRRIGMRSSTVRTWSGAEVILPNSKLVSENVINWTLSDNLRRIEIPIGVAYGTDPERVLALLADVAVSNPEVLSDPAPSAIFVAHGNSSLDFELRAWTSSREWYALRSQLTVAINRAIREAGITIPFPQRDLHLRSIDSNARRVLELSSDENGSEGGDPPADQVGKKET